MPNLSDEQRAQLDALVQEREKIQTQIQPLQKQVQERSQAINDLMRDFRRGAGKGQGQHGNRIPEPTPVPPTPVPVTEPTPDVVAEAPAAQ